MARNFADTVDYGLGPAMRGYMLCAGDEKTEPYQCSSLITARLLKYQNKNTCTYFKYSTTDKPRRHSGGKPLLPGWQGAVQVPRPTAMVYQRPFLRHRQWKVSLR